RIKVLLRIFYIIPAYLIVYVMTIVLELAGIAAWLVIVVIGKLPKGLYDAQSAQIGQPAGYGSISSAPSYAAPEAPGSTAPPGASAPAPPPPPPPPPA